jgi:hypothetical protein
VLFPKSGEKIESPIHTHTHTHIYILCVRVFCFVRTTVHKYLNAIVGNTYIFIYFMFIYIIYIYQLVMRFCARSKPWVCSLSLAGIVGSNLARGHGCVSLVGVVCCQVDVSTSGRSLVQRSPAECGVSECDLEASIIRRPWPTGGCCTMGRKNAIMCLTCLDFCANGHENRFWPSQISVTCIIIIPFMQGIHTYVPETNRVARVHSVTAIPRILLMVLIVLSAILTF